MSSSDPQDVHPTTIPHESDLGSALAPDDAAAVDALFDAGLSDPSRVFSVDSRAGRLIKLLSMLETIRFSAEERESLVQATMARVTIERHRQKSAPEPVLVPDDEDALEALVSAEFELSRVPHAMRERAARHMALLGLLDAPVAEKRDELVASTLAKIQSSIDSEESRFATPVRMRQTVERAGLRSFIRSREIVSVAALVLIATALLTPLAQYFREYSRRTACASNMAAAGVAFGQYAAAYQDQLPLASASRPGNLFWNVGKQRDQSNSANLFQLKVTSYATVEQLACAGQITSQCRSLAQDKNAWDWPDLKQVTVSFQNMFAAERPRWSQNNRAVVLADASPVIRRAVQGRVIYPFENSANHMRRGQNVLWSDGSSQWLKSPVLPNNDNIWLPRPIEAIINKMTKPHEADPLRGNESPSTADDAFVGP